METERHQDHPLPDGEYYHHQLIGLKVRTTQGELLGSVTEILTGRSNDNYIVRGDEGEILIPAIEDVVKAIDLDEGYITIEAMDGLLELNKKKPPR